MWRKYRCTNPDCSVIFVKEGKEVPSEQVRVVEQETMGKAAS